MFRVCYTFDIVILFYTTDIDYILPYTNVCINVAGISACPKIKIRSFSWSTEVQSP